MAKCTDCSHYEVCKKYGAVVDFDVDDGVCLNFEPQAIHCRDCKHYTPEGSWCEIHSHFSGDEWNSFGDDDYCSYGERKETDGKEE